MSDVEEIYLVGPVLNNYDTNQFKGKTTFAFSGDLVWYSENDIHPTYWSFLDPNSTLYIFDSHNNGKYNDEWFSKLKNNTTLIYNDFQGTDKFYEEGFTTSRGQTWNREQFGKLILPQLQQIFKETIKLPTVTLIDNYDSLYEQQDVTPIIRHQNKDLNTEKFSCFVLPLVMSYFKNLKKIYCVGWGDFSVPREYNNSVLGYEGYKQSYQKVKQPLKNVIDHKNVKLVFNNLNSYFYEIGDSEEMMNKITFCIPSKSNLRYLQTCIPSIRNNAYRKDHDIIVFVDSDEDGTVEWLEQNAEEWNVKYLTNPDLGNSLYGIGEAYDYCIREAETDVVMIFHADMMLGKDADFHAFKHLTTNKSVVCSTRIEPPIHPNAGEKILEDFGMWPEDFKSEEFDEYVTKLIEDNSGKTTDGIFAPWMVYRDDFLSMGGHDPIMKSAREDSDVFNRMKLDGFTFVQPWDSLVYHLTGRGGQFQHGKITQDHQQKSEEWQKLMANSTKEFIRKWNSSVNHTPLMHPIVSPRYDISFVVSNCDANLMGILEPWCDQLHLTNTPNDVILHYIKTEQPNTQFDLSKRVISSDQAETDVVVEFDARRLTQQSFNMLHVMSDIIKDSGEVGQFEIDIFKLTIRDMVELQDSLVGLTDSWYTDKLLEEK